MKDKNYKTERAEFGMYRKYIKRLIDIVISLLGMVLASWLYLIIIIAIKLDDHGPVFFVQARTGLNKREFKLIKFRSMKMTAPHDKATHEFENPDEYITKVGRFLRKTSLDEIPQLWNIFVGDMSIIGPRPVICSEKDLIDERDKYGANDVRPGLSGWAQINGRDVLGYEDKARYDGEYVEKMSFRFDCKCFLTTAVVALRGLNVVEGKHPVKIEPIPTIKPIEENTSKEMIV
jgi:O-antigen biosynthesis protein WbqP